MTIESLDTIAHELGRRIHSAAEAVRLAMREASRPDLRRRHYRAATREPEEHRAPRCGCSTTTPARRCGNSSPRATPLGASATRGSASRRTSMAALSGHSALEQPHGLGQHHN